MSNEELATAIKSGRRDLVGQLWSQNKGWIRLRAIKFHSCLRKTRGLTVEDLEQQGFLALMACINNYEEDRGSFINFLTWYLRNYFYQAAGLRTEKQDKDPINSAVSLYQPIDGEDGDMLIDLQAADDHSIEDAEERLYTEQLRSDLLTAISRLPERQARIIKARYFEGRTLASIAPEMQVTRERVRAIEEKSLRQLREDKALRQYREEIIDWRTNFYLHTNYMITFQSPVERLVDMREQWRRSFKG